MRWAEEGALPKTGVFLVRLPKNSRRKKLKLKENMAKTQGLFPRKLKKSANFRNLIKFLAQKLPFWPKMLKIFQILQDLSKTQAQNLSKTQETGKSTILHCPPSALKKPVLDWSMAVPAWSVRVGH